MPVAPARTYARAELNVAPLSYTAGDEQIEKIESAGAAAASHVSAVVLPARPDARAPGAARARWWPDCEAWARSLFDRKHPKFRPPDAR